MKHKQWKRWTAALAAAAILFTPLATRAQTPDTTQQPLATDKPAATQQPDTVPPTGDAGQLMVYVAAMGAAALLMGAAVAVRKRKEG